MGKFPAIDWRPVLRVVRTTCLPNITEIGDWLQPSEPYGSKKKKRQTFTCLNFPYLQSLLKRDRQALIMGGVFSSPPIVWRQIAMCISPPSWRQSRSWSGVPTMPFEILSSCLSQTWLSLLSHEVWNSCNFNLITKARLSLTHWLTPLSHVPKTKHIHSAK